MIAVACIAGSLIASNPKYGVDYGREYVFHTWWFLGLMGLLLVNLCLCSWEKSYIALTLYKKKNFVESPRFFQKLPHAAAFPWKGNLETVYDALKTDFSIVQRRAGAFYAQKGLLGRCGATIIHIGLLWTMISGYCRILADDYGWGVYDATIILPEGESSKYYFTRIDRLKDANENNMKPYPLPFKLRELDFNASYYPHSTVAKGFASLVELTDGKHKQIHEITMTHPVLYKGYKITQNSFRKMESIVRGKFQVADSKSGKTIEVDAIPGDPVPLRGIDNDKHFLQVDKLSAGGQYHVLDLVSQKIIETGGIQSPAENDAPLPIDTSGYAAQLRKSKYSMLVAALFPDFIFDENKQPTTKDDKFNNPAVLAMLFKHGKPNGYLWLFHNKPAQAIMGQPHPELSMTFEKYRVRPGVEEAKSLLDYEVEIAVSEKATSRTVGTFWVQPGELQEIPVSKALVNSPPIRMPSTADSTKSDTSATVSTRIAENGTSQSTSTATEAANSGPHRFEVTYLGPTAGNVAFLGFMRDPSVTWIFTGCLIIIFGTLIAFILVYRESWVWYDEAAGMLYMGFMVRGTSPRCHRQFDRLIQKVRSLSETGEKPSSGGEEHLSVAK